MVADFKCPIPFTILAHTLNFKLEFFRFITNIVRSLPLTAGAAGVFAETEG